MKSPDKATPQPTEIEVALDYAIKNKTMIITTIEAFHKEPELAYRFFNLAANAGVEVHLAPIKTTDTLSN